MTWLDALAISAALLLVGSGGAKLSRPTGLTIALFAAGFTRGTAIAARILAAVELGVGVGILTTGSAVFLAAAAALYAGFTGFVVWALVKPDRMLTCGCTGHPDTPPTWAHAVVTGIAAFVLANAAALGGWSSTQVFGGDEPLTTAVVLGDAVIVAVLAWATISVLPLVPKTPERNFGSVDEEG